MSSQGVHSGLAAISNERSNAPIVARFFRFAVALAVLPPLVYYCSLQALKDKSLSAFPTGFTPPIIAGIAAVLVINLIISTFALLAVLEPSHAPTSAHIDDIVDIDDIVESETESHSKDD